MAGSRGNQRSACARCGSDDLRAASVTDGNIPGLIDVQWLVVCRRCGWQGVPLEFDSDAEFAAHQAAVAGWQDAGEPLAIAWATPGGGPQTEATAGMPVARGRPRRASAWGWLVVVAVLVGLVAFGMMGILQVLSLAISVLVLVAIVLVFVRMARKR